MDYNLSNPKVLLLNPPVSKSVFETKKSDFEYQMLRKTEEHWRKLRNNGIVLTSLGAACVITGTALLQADIQDWDGNADGTRAVFGIMGIAGGIISLGGGITMWAIGNNRLRKMEDFSLKTTGNSAGIVYKF